MRRSTRTILFFSCLVIFLISCPIILAYSIGYAFDINGKKIVPTGSISIKSFPKNATISLNGILSEKVSPSLIPNLSAGLYDVEISKTNYLPWKETIEVKDFHLTSIDNILLFPKYPLSRKVTDDLRWIHFAPSRLFAIGMQKETLSPILLNLSINEMPAFSSIDNDYKIVSIEPDSIAWSAKEKYVSFFAILNNGQKGFYYFDSSNPQKITPIILGLYSDLQIVWHSVNDNIVLCSHENQITQKNLSSEEEIIIAEEAIQFFSKNNKIYFIQQDSGFIYVVDDPWIVPSKNSEIKKEQFTENSISTNNKYNFFNITNDQFLAHGDDGSIFNINKKSINKIRNYIDGVDISDQGKILTYRAHEINLLSDYDLELQDVPVTSETAENISALTLTEEEEDLSAVAPAEMKIETQQFIHYIDEPIKKLSWITNNHIAYLLENGNFFIAELDNDGLSNTIFPIKDTMEDFWISKNSNSVYPVLYYIEDGELYKMDWEL